MIDKVPMYFVIHEEKMEQYRLHRGDAPSVAYFIPEGIVCRRMQALDGSQRYEYRKLLRLEGQPINAVWLAKPTWSAPLHPHEMPPLLALYVTLSQ